ncbi:MAG: pitrilysin family protein [Bryobacterales bacterium]|nr:pitrilysin family protein [Bryobacterales bacterium]MDE0627798.1 pitrilysin family protein [Bryobacterales bacterium]
MEFVIDIKPQLIQAVAIACFAGVLATPVSAQVDIPYEKFVLDNGLRLLVHEDRKAPIVSVNVWYHVGSKNEKPGKTGFAHLFEHLMFNGSENFNDDYFQAMERVGATSLNGTTSSDRTNYFQNVPRPALDLALWMESDRMGNMLGAVDQAKLDEQRGVVQNEKRQGENQPYAVAYELITKNTYPRGHPYSWTVIGEMEDLDDASLEDVHEWFRTYYGAANAVISIAGDIAPEEARDLVDHYFGSIPAGPPVARHRAWVARRTGEQRQTVEDRVPQARVIKVWNVPQWGTREAVLLDLATDVLAAGKSSRLYKRLVYEDQIATSATAYVNAREIAGQVALQGTAQPGGDLATVEAALDEELARFLREGPAQDELERAKMDHKARFIRGMERIGGFGGKSDILARNEVFSGDPSHYKRMLAWAEGASPEEIRSVAAEYLSDGAYVLEIHPAPQRSETTDQVDRSGLPSADGFPEFEFPDRAEVMLSNGLRVIHASVRSVPTVEISLILNAGYAADQLGVPGLAKMTAEMLDEGTEGLDSLQISDEATRLGARISASAGLDTATVTISALTERLAESLDLYADVILRPSFPQAELDRVRQLQIAGIQQEMSQPFTVGLRLLPGLLYGPEHAYSAPMTGSGSIRSVTSLTRDDIVDFHRKWYTPDNATFLTVGDVPLDKLRPMLEERFGSWSAEGDAPSLQVADVPLPGQRNVYLVDKPGALQSVIIAGLPAPPTNNPDEVAIGTMNTILGGSFTSRINMNLREDKHWSYGARSLLVDARGPRMFMAYSPVQTDKTRESMVEIDRELRDILSGRPPEAEELSKAQRSQTLRLPGQYETKRAVLSALRRIEVYGLDDDHFETFPGKVRALELGDIERAASAIVHPDRMVWIVIGDLSKIESGVRELEFGDVRRLSPEGEVLD